MALTPQRDPALRAQEAAQLLQTPLIVEGLAMMTAVYTAALRQCVAKDDLGRFRYAVALDVIDGVKRHLETVLSTGKLPIQDAQEFQTDTTMARVKAAVTRIF